MAFKQHGVQDTGIQIGGQIPEKFSFQTLDQLLSYDKTPNLPIKKGFLQYPKTC
jgi:hypothetical protein